MSTEQLHDTFTDYLNSLTQQGDLATNIEKAQSDLKGNLDSKGATIDDKDVANLVDQQQELDELKAQFQRYKQHTDSCKTELLNTLSILGNKRVRIAYKNGGSYVIWNNEGDLNFKKEED